MPFEKGASGNPGGRPKNLGHIRMLARSHSPEAIDTLAYWMRQRENPYVSVAASNAILDRAWGKAAPDPDAREHINITIRKILEGSVTVTETSPSREIVTIDHNEDEKVDE